MVPSHSASSYHRYGIRQCASKARHKAGDNGKIDTIPTLGNVCMLVLTLVLMQKMHACVRPKAS